MRRSTFLLTSLIVSAVAVFCSFGCGPSASQGGGEQPAAAAGESAPELTDDVIRERINYAFVRKVPEENGASEPINWTFAIEEPKDITVVEKQVEGDHAAVVLDIKTGSGPRAREPRRLSGQIRTEWVLRTGWVLRKWEIVDVENISMKYKNLPKPPDQNSNR